MLATAEKIQYYYTNLLISNKISKNLTKNRKKCSKITTLSAYDENICFLQKFTLFYLPTHIFTYLKDRDNFLAS
jgi:hypothetical protein